MTVRCGNCPHDPDLHSPVGNELCAARGCPCPGLLTVRADETATEPAETPSTPLTEREAVRYQEGRRDALDGLIVEFERYPDGTWAVERIRAALEHVDRITGPLELPEAPCAIGTVRAGAPILCGYPAGHAGHHAWTAIPPDPPAAADRRKGRWSPFSRN